MAGIELKHIQKAYTVDGRTLPVLKDICLQIPENSITVLLGKSGCGKTTLLRLVGDLEKPNSGEIRFAVTHKTAFVFQEPRLMPWLTVWDNTIFGLKKHSYDTGEIQALLETVGLDGFQKAYPHQLSGGMQQRTAIARALAYAPSFLLMDEPFAALDHFTRTQLQKELIRLQAKIQGFYSSPTALMRPCFWGIKLPFLRMGASKKNFFWIRIAKIAIYYPRN